jgi:hypothetical protein
MDKDWTGNKNSIFKTLGASNHTTKERENNDYYATDPIAIDSLIRGQISHKVWEVACGEGHLSERLKEYGHEVYSTDLIDRGYGVGGIDFLECPTKWDGDILTNPPYKFAQQFVEHSLELINDGSKVFMFLKLQFLEGKARRKLFDTGCLKTLWVSTSRILCAKNARFEEMKAGGSAVAYAWFEFKKGFTGDPTIKWIN